MRNEKHIAAEYLTGKRKKKKLILTGIIVIMIISGAAELVILKNMTSVDMRFIRGAERGVAKGWANSGSDLQLKYSGRISDTDFIEIELDAVKEFRNAAYNDKNLKSLSKRYIDDLKKCKAAADTYDPQKESGEFWQSFSAPYTDRLIVLSNLYRGDYRIGKGWDNYPEQRDEILSRAWAAEAVSKLKFERTNSDNGIDRFSAVLENDSGFDIDYISINIDVYNKQSRKNGSVIAYKEEIKNGSNTSLTFYYNSDEIAYYSITGADCIIAQSEGKE